MDAIGETSLLSGDPNPREMCFGDDATFTVTASFLGDSSEEVTFDLSGNTASVGFRGWFRGWRHTGLVRYGPVDTTTGAALRGGTFFRFARSAAILRNSPPPDS
jgi:hypothetical protein